MKRRSALMAVLGIAGVLLGANVSQAQSYFLGYYYPAEKRFHTNDLATEITYDYAGQPGFLPGEPPASGVRPNAAGAPASVRVVVPNSQATVWFGGYKTNSTGTERAYQTPALQPGSSYDYKVKVTYTQDGQQLVQERTISVAAGQAQVIDFTDRAAAASTGKP